MMVQSAHSIEPQVQGCWKSKHWKETEDHSIICQNYQEPSQSVCHQPASIHYTTSQYIDNTMIYWSWISSGKLTVFFSFLWLFIMIFPVFFITAAWYCRVLCLVRLKKLISRFVIRLGWANICCNKRLWQAESSLPRLPALADNLGTIYLEQGYKGERLQSNQQQYLGSGRLD